MADEDSEIPEESKAGALIPREDGENSLLYEEIFFIDNGSQSNIYCSTKLRYPMTTQERFLVGTLKGKVSCLERCDDVDAREKFHSSHDMQAREVYFSYIPGDAELISMDAFYKYQTVHGSKCLIVGVTLILLKPNNKDAPPKHFFNIYNALEPGTEFDLDSLAQVCQHQRLGFIPYQLFHADIYVNDGYETVFLLSGSDKQIHVFRGDDQQKFDEHPCGKYFPEFTDIPERVIWMDIKMCDSYKRISAFGCDNGYVRVSIANVLSNDIISQWVLPMDGPISSVRLFTLTTQKEILCKDKNDALSPRHAIYDTDDVNVLVTSALEASVVFLNVAKSGLDNMIVLNKSDQFDSVTCSCITDIDCDGNLEIILGTYGQELLVYKWSLPSNGFSHLVHFDLVWQKEFCKPLLSIHGLDVMGDGMQELVVVSLTGVHILQHEVEQAADKLLEKIIKTFPEKSVLHETKIEEYFPDFDNEEEEEEETESENTELEEVIKTICSTTNSYNELSNNDIT